MYTINPCDDPYSRVIANAVARELPSQGTNLDPVLLDLIFIEIVGTKQQRYGPKPSPEAQVAIREVISKYVAIEWPIPFVVPWGSEKPVEGATIDIAELWALKALKCLNTRVRGHYAPGLQFRLRVEDASASYLFYDRAESAEYEASRYSDDLEQLVKILGLTMIQCARESRKVTARMFNQMANNILVSMEEYLHEPGNTQLVALRALGWENHIPFEAVTYYLGQYYKLYPNDTHAQHLHRLARYFASSWARRRLGLIGDDVGWMGVFLELAFFAPIPGIQFGRRVFYRTIPCSLTANHMPPWRSKGYMLIQGNGEVCPKLASFQERKQYNLNTVTIADGDKAVTLQADYIIS